MILKYQKTSTEAEPKDVEKIIEYVKEVKRIKTKVKVKADDKKTKKAKVSKVKFLNHFEGIENLA